MVASCAINCGVVADSVVSKGFYWADTGTATSTWADSSRGLHVDNDTGLLATAGAVFVKSMLLSGWTFSFLFVTVHFQSQLSSALMKSPGDFWKAKPVS